MTKRHLTSAFLVTAALATAPAVATSLAQDPASGPADSAPPLPESGDTVRVAGPDGQDIICPDGQPLLVTIGEDPVPEGVTEIEEVTPAEARADGVAVGGPAWKPDVAEIVEAAAPRCGPDGGGQDGDPIWVPETIGDDRVVAPERFVEQQAK